MIDSKPYPSSANGEKKNRFDVVMLTSVHPAADDRIFHREAKTLAEAGLSVCIIGPYPSSVSIDKVWIEAIPRQTNRLRRLAMGWMVLKCALRLGNKLFIFHDPELFGVGLILRLFGKQVVYDCHENLPMQILQKDWIPKPLRWILVPEVWLLEWVSSRLLSGVICAREAVLRRFPKRRTVLVRNFASRAALSASNGTPVHLRSAVVIYAGGLARIRGIRELVAAFQGTDLGDAQLWLMGPFESEEFQQEILKSLPVNAKWLGWKDHSEVLRTYPSAKIGVNLLYPTPSHRNSQPIKLYEYMAAGLPVVASNFPEFTSVLEGCGLQVDPRDVTQIKTALRALLSDNTRIAEMSRIGRSRVLDCFSWEKEGKTLFDFCSELIG